MQIPSGLREELNARLRQSGYSGLVGLSEWLSVLGYKIGKSAIHRYSVELKAQDRAHQTDATGRRGDLSNLTTSDMLFELGMLRVREHQIIKRLADIGYIGQLNLQHKSEQPCTP